MIENGVRFCRGLAVWNNLQSLYLRELPDLAYQEIPSTEEIEDSLITILSTIK